MSALSVPPFRLTVGGVEYVAEMAECEEFSLTVEDHGLFTALISFRGPGWGQGLPARALDNWDEGRKERVGTAFGMDFVIEAVRVLGSPENAKGKRVVVLRRGQPIEGFAALRDDGSIGEPFIPDLLRQRHYPEDES